MDNQVNYALVGLFVITLSIALVASILWLSVGTQPKVYDTYQVYIKESVSGLNQQAPVKYRGVEVGYVQDIALVANRPNEVRVLLDIEQGVPIKQDTLVLLATQGLTGLAHIELTGGSRDALPPVRQPGQPYPEIQTKPSLLVRLDTAISGLLSSLDKVSNLANTYFAHLNSEMMSGWLSNFSKLSRAMDTLLSEDNVIAVTNTLHNLNVISHTVATRAPDIDTGLVNLEQATDNIKNITLQLSGLLTQLKSSLAALETTSNAFTDTAKMVNQMVESNRQDVEQTTQAVAKTASNISVAVQESRQDMNYFTRQALPEVTTSLRELQILLNTLRNFTQELERKPNMLLFGKSKPALGPGE